MRKKYYIVTANSSEPTIFHPKNSPNTLIFSKARCRWDYAEKVSECDDCIEIRNVNGRPIFKIVEPEFQHGKSSKFLSFLFLICLSCLNLIVLLLITGKDFLNLSGPIYEMSGTITTVSGILLAIFNAHGMRKRLSRILLFGPKNNKIYLISLSTLSSIIISAFLWYFDILKFSNSMFGVIAFLISWTWF